MNPRTPQARTAPDLLEANRRFYDALWRDARLVEPERFNTGPLVHSLARSRGAAYGMQPQSSRLLDFGMWFLTNRRPRVLWWYNRMLMPLAVRFQTKLALTPGMMDSEKVDEILLVRRQGSCTPPHAVTGENCLTGPGGNAGRRSSTSLRDAERSPMVEYLEANT